MSRGATAWPSPKQRSNSLPLVKKRSENRSRWLVDFLHKKRGSWKLLRLLNLARKGHTTPLPLHHGYTCTCTHWQCVYLTEQRDFLHKKQTRMQTHTNSQTFSEKGDVWNCAHIEHLFWILHHDCQQTAGCVQAGAEGERDRLCSGMSLGQAYLHK